MSPQELNEKLMYWLGPIEQWDDVLKVIERYAAEERSEGYSKGWDDGYAQAETDNAFDNLDLLH